jgi:hypothetical protein
LLHRHGRPVPHRVADNSEARRGSRLAHSSATAARFQIDSQRAGAIWPGVSWPQLFQLVLARWLVVRKGCADYPP